MTVEQRIKQYPTRDRHGDIVSVRLDTPLAAITTGSDLSRSIAIRVDGVWFEPSSIPRSLDRRWEDALK